MDVQRYDKAHLPTAGQSEALAAQSSGGAPQSSDLQSLFGRMLLDLTSRSDIE